jgi:hypothetical protein
MDNNSYDATPSDDVTQGTDVALLERRLKGLKGQATNVVSTIKGDSFEDRLKTMELVTGSTPFADLGDGGTIGLVDVIVQTIEMDGNAVPRVILVDENGDAYHAISSPILGSIETLFGVVGADTSKWARPISTTLVKVKAAKGTAFTLSFS